MYSIFKGNLVTLRMPPNDDRDDEEMMTLMNDLKTMEHLRIFGLTHEPDGWTLDEIRQRRENHRNNHIKRSAAPFWVYLNGQSKDSSSEKKKLVGTVSLNDIGLSFQSKFSHSPLLLHSSHMLLWIDFFFKINLSNHYKIFIN